MNDIYSIPEGDAKIQALMMLENSGKFLLRALRISVIDSMEKLDRRYLQNQYGKCGPRGVGFLSLASLLPGPWNLSSSGDAWTDVAYTTFGKVPVAQGIARAATSKNAGVARAAAGAAEGLGLLGIAGLALTLGATAENIHAFNVPCPCDQ